MWAGFGPTFLKPVGQQEETRMLLERFPRVPIRKTYTFDWYAHGTLNPDKPFASRVLMHYEIMNDEEHGLGRFPLQPGKVRIFIDDGRGGEAFLGEDWARLTPLDDTLRLYLGEARDVVFTRTIQDNQRHPVRGNLFDQEIWIQYEIENFKDKPVTRRHRRAAQPTGRRVRPRAARRRRVGPRTGHVPGDPPAHGSGRRPARAERGRPRAPAGSERRGREGDGHLPPPIKNLW